MLTLALLRHAKSSWDDPGRDDFHRPLAERGHDAAPRMGRWMAAHGIAPDFVLCSTAERTRATLDLVLPQLAPPVPPVRLLGELYLASARELLACVHAVEPGPRVLLVVGHNPGLHRLALLLVGQGNREQIGALRLKLPTAGLVVLRFAGPRWRDVAAGAGELRAFASPRRLS